MGPVGAGKTCAISAISDIEVVSTEAMPTDGTASLKSTTTVAMDVGILRLDHRTRIRLYGAPGQERFSFMADILAKQSRGIVLLINDRRPDPVGDMHHHLNKMTEVSVGRHIPVVVGITHLDSHACGNLKKYQYSLRRHSPCNPGPIPILSIDARKSADVKALLIALVSIMEICKRFPMKTRSSLHTQ